MSTKTEDKTEGQEADSFQKGRPLLPRASGAVRPASTKADNVKSQQSSKPKPGMPEGYKPDTSVQYVKGKEGKDGEPGDDQIKGADGKTSAVNPSNQASSMQNAMEQLGEGHTYRDRVEAQARSLGVEVIEDETLELLLWKIRMQASS